LTRVPQAKGPSLWKSEKVAWEQGHVPGASYLHLIEDLCDPQARLPFMLPGKEKVSALLGRFGVLDESIIVLYGFAGEWVTHRVWWSLKASGLADVKVLDGGFLRWQSEGQPIERKAPSIDPTEIQCERDERLIATRADTIQSTSSAKIVAVNALAPELFRGEGDQVFGRRGHIPGSINIPSDDLIEAETGRIRPIEDLQAIFLGHGLDAAETIIPYCGGGIAASTLFFALAIAGYENVALYDGSLFDWSSDPTLPMELGA
jgi:thiosulfate/3-mercaptopyruvate sulfurtransferase